MILALDIGNTNIVISIYKYSEWRNVFRYDTKNIQPVSFYENALRNLLMEWDVKPSEIKLTVISSVVPDINNTIKIAVQDLTSCHIVFLNADIFMQLDMPILKPYEIGSDLVADAYAALKLYGDEVIVADFGTALSFTTASKSRGIIGVTLAPGLKTAVQSLVDQTAQLPMVPLEMPASVIGYDTTTAIQAGILRGYVGLVREIVAEIRSELGPEYKLIGTGGLSSVLHPLEQDFYTINKNLTLEGMRLIGEYSIRSL
jgi:type III pantothenate kinase